VAQFHAAAPGVHVLDSTHLSLDEVIDEICRFADTRVSP
jgi:cytidylate kinase